MNISISMFLLVAAFILFGLAAFFAPGWAHWPRLIAAGLLCATGSVLFGGG